MLSSAPLLLLHNSLCSLPCGVSLCFLWRRRQLFLSFTSSLFVSIFFSTKIFTSNPHRNDLSLFLLPSDFSDSSAVKTRLSKRPKTVHNLSLSLLKEGREMTRRAEFKLGLFMVLQFMFLLSLCESWFSSWIRVYKQKGFMTYHFP